MRGVPYRLGNRRVMPGEAGRWSGGLDSNQQFSFCVWGFVCGAREIEKRARPSEGSTMGLGAGFEPATYRL
jgi:hypothetical protein